MERHATTASVPVSSPTRGGKSKIDKFRTFSTLGLILNVRNLRRLSIQMSVGQFHDKKRKMPKEGVVSTAHFI